MKSLIKSSILLFILFLTNCKTDKRQFTGYDIELFKETPVWELAKAVEEENVNKIEEIVNLGKLNVDYIDPKLGMNLLNWAVFNDKLKSTKILAELGASPNIKDNMGVTALIEASTKLDNTSYLKILIENGASINQVCRIDNSFYTTALMEAAKFKLENVKILIDAGAEINFRDTHNYQTSLSAALISDRIEIVEYLLYKGANYKDPLAKWDGKYISISNFLRDLKFELDSKEYKVKMRVVDFLYKNGIDYWQEPISRVTMEEIKRDHPNDWENYLKKY
jgi:hypothetical protein